MARDRECPDCGAWMEYQPAEPDVGIEGGWECPECGYAETGEEDDDA